MNDLSRLQKGVLVTLLAMTVLFAVLTGIVRSQKGVQFADTLLRVAETATVYTGKIQGDNITVKVSGNVIEYMAEGGCHDVYTVEYPLEPMQTEHGPVSGIRILKNGEIMFKGGYDPDNEVFSWFDEKGEWDPLASFDVGGMRDVHDLTRGNVVYFVEGPELTSRGSWSLYLLVVLLTGLLAFDVWYPMALFYMQHCCDVRDPEPSDFYIAAQRVGWVVYPFLLMGAHIYILTHIW